MAYLKKATCFTFASTKTGTEKEEDKRKTKFYKNENFIQKQKIRPNYIQNKTNESSPQQTQ